ncbi:MAG: sugar ABC transporter permease [Anaerolineae bacterium]|nr:sugar ABC transporter permease [Anaerolineae bacterium]
MTVPALSPSHHRSRQRRVLVENLTAYAFLLPAGLLIFVFGLFPVGFAFFVSLHRWRRFPGEYVGLSNFVRGLDEFAYVLFFWLALGALGYGLMLLWRVWKEPAQRLRTLSTLIPGALNSYSILTLISWIGVLIPLIINIPQRVRGQERVPGLFVNELAASFQFPEAVAVGNQFLLAGLAALGLSLAWMFIVKVSFAQVVRGTSITLLAGISFLIFQLTTSEVQTAITAAQESGETLPIWSQVIFITLGVLLLVAAFWLWQRAFKAEGNRRFVGIVLAAISLMIGGYALAAELPRVLANADSNVLSGFNITVMFALGTVPFQLAIGLGLAYLLFQNIKGKSFFRIVYFMPYIMPFVATSIVFNIIFSQRPSSLINNLIGAFGVAPQKWLLEPTGIFRMFFGEGVPDVLVGPALALVVIMLYTTWTYIGYDAVVFLAGLGNISPELYEAARIDGASSWSVFRHITLPLLSPTTFFLSLIAVIGTFQSFTQIWIMRTPASQRSVDTLSIYIFETVRSNDPNMGYGSAMAFVLFGVILLLTIFQNRIMGSRVFYG